MLRQIYRVRAALFRVALERAYQAPVIPIVGTFWDYRADAWAAAIRKAARDWPGRSLHVLLQTNGGPSSSRSVVVRALSQHPTHVHVHVPTFAWSAGSSLACSAADTVHMGEDAVLGPLDPWTKDEPNTVYVAADVQAAAEGVPMSLVRSRNSLREAVESFKAARMERRMRRRGLPAADASDDALADTLIRGGWGNHWRPVFYEDAAALGLPVVPETDPTWAELARLCWEALDSSDR